MSVDHVSYSEFLRSSSSTVARLNAGDIVLERRDGEDLLLTTLGRSAALKEGLGFGADVLRRLANQDRELLSDLLVDQLPWLRWLPEPDRTECVRELVDDLAASVDTDNFIRFHQDLVAWRNTAEVWSDPARAEQLAGPFGEHGGEVERPNTDG